MAREFAGDCRFEYVNPEQIKKVISAVSQLINQFLTIQDQELQLSPHLFFKRLTSQLLHGAEEWDLKLVDQSAVAHDNHVDGIILFTGEVFARISRRGSAEILKFIKPEVRDSANPHALM